MDDIIAHGPFMGFEIDPCPARPHGAVNPGLGIGAEKGMPVYLEILKYYAGLSFINADGSYNTTDAVVNITTRELVRAGMKNTVGTQNIAGITIYPADYFNPFGDATGRLDKTKNTHTIHWYSKTWMTVSPMRQFVSRLVHRLVGVDTFARLRKPFHK